jgi:ATP-dependent Clp protease ATP-binding subunit ClpC
MTSNLGARFLDKKQQMGFAAPSNTGVPPKVEDQVMGEVKKAFNPEFLNRLDEIILFTSLSDEDLLKIVQLLVEMINVNLVPKQIKIRVNEDAAKYILEKTLIDRSYGARPLRRALQKYIEDPLSEALIQGTLPRPADLEVYLGDSGIFCRPIADELQEQPVGAPGAEAAPARSPGTPLYMF